MQPIISLTNVNKTYERRRRQHGRLAALRDLFSHEVDLIHAVNSISMQIQAGELVGYLGPNGAGKSTTMKMLSGLLVPTSGEISVYGYTPWRDRERYVRHIGAIFGQRSSLWWDLPVIESFEMLQHIYRIPPDRYQANLRAFREILELDPFLDSPVRDLSLGQRMRADLCAAMLHDPKILFLDEPTVGLDVVAKERMRQFIHDLHTERGVTILLTTHDLADVERLCERILIIDQGRLLYDGGLNHLRERFGGQRRLVVDFAEDYPTHALAGAQVIESAGRRVVFGFERGAISASELIGRLSSQFRIQDLSVEEPKLEETIRKIYVEGLLH